MGRILFWLLLAAAAYLGYRWWRIKQQQVVSRDATDRPLVETMVRCEVCGLALPQSEALRAGERWYCGDEHRRRAGHNGG